MAVTPVIPIAVIGMACRLPGGIDSPEALWEALLRGDDLVTEIPEKRFGIDIDEIYDPEPGVPGKTVSKWGSFLEDVAGFDAEFFGIGEREAAAIDPQHRLLLETSWEALEHAGLDPAGIAGTKTGVFVGLTHDDYVLLASDAGALEGPYGFVGSNFSMASGRVAYALGVHGPAVTVDTACSSGLVAIHLACRSLHEGESDVAIAGGAAVIMDPVRKSAAGSAQGMLSPTGHCHAFDAAADGFVSGEGCAVVLLKRLPDALADGDRILAVVRGTAANQDGRTMHIAVPSQDAQVTVYQAALDAGGVDAGSVGMVEAHGTGTPVGDPIEYRGLAQVYGTTGPCALGSLKTNFGHTQSASGAIGLMKAVLAVQHGVVPRSLHFSRLPDDLATIDTKLFVAQESSRWPGERTTPRRAAVSSYGMSGTNAHVVVEQPPAAQPQYESPRGGPAGAAAEPLLFPVSSTSADEVRRTAGRLADWLARSRDVSLPDLGYTLARRRAHRPVRTAVVAANAAELAEGLRDVAEGDTPFQPAVGNDDRGPVWVFSGQGSQWAAMGVGLLASEPVFAAAVAELEPLIAQESGFSVTEALTAPETVTGIERVQPTLFTMQVAIAATLRAHGVQPGAVIGHSLGEAAASVVAGALSLADGARVICRRSKLMSRIAGSGAMASVDLPAPQVLSELAARGVNDVVLSVVSSPKSTVVGGVKETVRELLSAWEARGVMAREVAVDVASHSPQVNPILAQLREVLAGLDPGDPTVPYYSATLYDPRDPAPFDADYWADNLRHTVRFGAAVQAALEDGHRVFAELAPHPVLLLAIEQTARSLDAPLATLASMRREQELPHGLRPFVADLHSAGAAVDFSVSYPDGRLLDAPLPTWNRHRLILTPDGGNAQSHGAHTVSVHPLLGAHVRLLEEPERHAWQGDVGTAALPWLDGHQVNKVATFPGAGYCEMALAAGHTVIGGAVEVRDIRFEQMLLLDAHSELSAVASVGDNGVVTFLVETDAQQARTRRASAVLHPARDPARGDDAAPVVDIAALLTLHPGRIEGSDMRQLFAAVGIQYGPAFAGLVAVHTGTGVADSVLAEVRLPSVMRSQQAAYHVHPALLDACFQSVAAHPVAQAASTGDLLLPLGVRRLRCYGHTKDARYCHTRVAPGDGAAIEADLDILDEHGTVLISVRGLQMGAGASDSGGADRILNERLLTIEWQQRAVPEATASEAGTWLIITASDAADLLATKLADALKMQDAQFATIAWPHHADHEANVKRLRELLAGNRFAGVLVLTEPRNGDPDEEFATRGRDYVAHLVRIAGELADVQGEASRLYLVTRNAQLVRSDDEVNPEQAGLRGLMRVIGTEHPHLHPTQIDVDEQTDAELLAQQLLAGSEEDETAWRDGQWYTARMFPSPLRPEERHTTVVRHDRDGMRLQIRTPGDMQSMELAAFDRVPPGPGQIEVAVNASSVNIADVLVAFGMYPSFEGRLPRLGTDFAGVVTAIGPGVTRHRVGDHVGGMSANGCWGTFVITDEHLAVRLPSELPDDQAAAVTTAYGTAWYGLHDLARISSRDKVLIHSATGGVGQAAIAIARSVGAEIFATAGSPERRRVLAGMGIEHVYDSRSTEFAELIRRDTGGYGVDIVLNSLTGAAQRAGLELLSFGGRFIEIGKRDIYGDTRLGLFPFRRNISFYGVDFGLLAFSHPEKIQEVLDTVYRAVADAELAPPDTTHYPLADAATAIRVMSGAGHIGKLVLDVPHTGESAVVLPPEQVRVFRPDGAYIVTGGLGGLGLYLAERMAAAGCGRIVLNGRSEPTQEALAAIARVRSTGADIVVECGDIGQPSTAHRVVAVAKGTGLPVRGVLHAAAVVEDATLTNISDELLERDWAPKVNGAENLHRATADQPLDWFCSFSSAAGLVGSPGQGAYAAANSWLDGFTHWRRAHGLPATSIAWGAWGEIGRGRALAEGADIAISPDEGAYAFESLLRHDRGYSGYAPIKGTPWLTAFAKRSRFFEAFKSAAGQSGTDAGRFRVELFALPQEEWPSRLRRLISDQLSLILRRSIDPDRPLSEYGVDSLGNLELRTRIETETGVRVTTTEITTVRALAGHLYEKLAAEAATSEENT